MSAARRVRGYTKISFILLTFAILGLVSLILLNGESYDRHSKVFNQLWIVWGQFESGQKDLASYVYISNYYQMSTVLSNLSSSHYSIHMQRTILEPQEVRNLSPFTWPSDGIACIIGGVTLLSVGAQLIMQILTWRLVGDVRNESL